MVNKLKNFIMLILFASAAYAEDNSDTKHIDTLLNVQLPNSPSTQKPPEINIDIDKLLNDNQEPSAIKPATPSAIKEPQVVPATKPVLIPSNIPNPVISPTQKTVEQPTKSPLQAPSLPNIDTIIQAPIDKVKAQNIEGNDQVKNKGLINNEIVPVKVPTKLPENNKDTELQKQLSKQKPSKKSDGALQFDGLLTQPKQAFKKDSKKSTFEIIKPEQFWQGSFMFNDDEVNQLNEVVNELVYGPVKTVKTEKPTPLKVLQTKTDKIVVLNSIVYFSPDKWTIWINGVKHNQDNYKAKNSTGIEIISISPAKVSLRVHLDSKTAVPDRVDISEVDHSPRNKKVNYNFGSEFVEFELYTNQKFSSKLMKIVEVE